MVQEGIAETVIRYDFEDTYDGLGDDLDEKDDDLNDDTFGASEPVGMEFISTLISFEILNSALAKQGRILISTVLPPKLQILSMKRVWFSVVRRQRRHSPLSHLRLHQQRQWPQRLNPQSQSQTCSRRCPCGTAEQRLRIMVMRH